MIESFLEGYRWLSNFAPVRIVLGGFEYPSVENAYVSAKCNDPAWKHKCSSPKFTPGMAKREGRSITLTPDWETIKDEVMFKCLQQKFSQQPYMWLLLSTKDQVIQEGNTWGDKYWGVDLATGEGENKLGKMLMQIRETIKLNGPYPIPRPTIKLVSLHAGDLVQDVFVGLDLGLGEDHGQG
jgi:hypothetical protein